MKQLLIDQCGKCFYFGFEAYPYCKKTLYRLDYPDVQLPSWCPLPDANDLADNPEPLPHIAVHLPTDA
jgi:hypothetical protein